MDELRGAARQALVLGELASEAADALVPGERAHGVDSRLDLIPGGGHLHARLGEEVLAVVHDRGVGRVGDREELVPVHPGVPHRLDDVIVLELVHGKLEDPLVGGELRHPHIVHGDDVVGVGLGLGVVDQGLTLLIRFRGQLDELDRFVRVCSSRRRSRA